MILRILALLCLATISSAVLASSGSGLAALIGMVLGAAYFIGRYRRCFLGVARSTLVPEGHGLATTRTLASVHHGRCHPVHRSLPGGDTANYSPQSQAWLVPLHS